MNLILNQKYLDFLFLVEHYIIKMDIIRYYLLPNSTALKLCNRKKNEYIPVQK